jgi:hypothetical protein
MCPPLLAEAFWEALRGAVSALSSPDFSPSDSKHSHKAAELLNIYELGEPSRDFQAKFVNVQVSVLLVIEAQSRTFNPTARQTGGSLSRWISGAVNLALETKLHLTRPLADADITDDVRLTRRLWVSLCVLDRLFSHSTGSPVRIAEDHFTFKRQDAHILGEPLLYLARKFAPIVPTFC